MSLLHIFLDVSIILFKKNKRFRFGNFEISQFSNSCGQSQILQCQFLSGSISKYQLMLPQQTTGL
jgi:hypothetical protein